MADKDDAFPSRANLTIYKNKIKSTTNGLGLIKRKRDAIDIQIRRMEDELNEMQPHLNEHMSFAIMILIHGHKLLATDLRTLLVCPDMEASAVCSMGKKKIMGVPIDTITLELRKSKNLDLVGLATGGSVIQEARKKFQDILVLLIGAGSTKMAVRALEKERKEVSTRVNAIELVVIPRLKKTYQYIENELEEREREEFYRMKKSREKRRSRANKNKLGSGYTADGTDGTIKGSLLDLSKYPPFGLLCSCKEAAAQARIKSEKADLSNIPANELLCGCKSPQGTPLQDKSSQGKKAKDKLQIADEAKPDKGELNALDKAKDLEDTIAEDQLAIDKFVVAFEAKKAAELVEAAAPEILAKAVPQQQNCIGTTRRTKKRNNKMPQEKSMQTDDPL